MYGIFRNSFSFPNTGGNAVSGIALGPVNGPGQKAMERSVGFSVRSMQIINNTVAQAGQEKICRGN